MIRLPRLLLLCLLPGLQAWADTDLQYRLSFSAEFLPGTNEALVTIGVEQEKGALQQLNFSVPGDHFRLVGDHPESDGERLAWQVPAGGGRVQWRYKVDRLRGKQQRYEARMTGDHVIARLDDVFPNARARTRKGAAGVATLSITGPDGWSFESPYGPLNQTIDVSMQGRKYGRPSGWLIGGELSRRREDIAGAIVTVSAPKGIVSKPMERLIFLRHTLPTLAGYLPLPQRLSVVVVPDSMWRGALSGPNSIYINRGRPDVSENGTSTILHEVAHTAGLHSAEDGDDWVVEGLAEYLSVLTLLESGGMSQARFERVIAGLEAWAAREKGRLQDPSSGADTAAAVVLFDQLRRELESEPDGFRQVVKKLSQCQPVSASCLAAQVEAVLGRTSDVLR